MWHFVYFLGSIVNWNDLNGLQPVDQKQRQQLFMTNPDLQIYNGLSSNTSFNRSKVERISFLLDRRGFGNVGIIPSKKLWVNEGSPSSAPKRPLLFHLRLPPLHPGTTNERRTTAKHRSNTNILCIQNAHKITHIQNTSYIIIISYCTLYAYFFICREIYVFIYSISIYVCGPQ